MFVPIEDAIRNFLAVFSCVTDYPCRLVDDTVDGGIGASLIIVLGLLAGGAVFSGIAAGTVLPMKDGPATVLGIIVSTFFWFWLGFGYAVPEFTNVENRLIWAFIVPLYTAFLILGLVIMAAYALFLATSLKDPGRFLPDTWWARSLIMAVMTGAVLAWQLVYTENPAVAAGPFAIGPDWFQTALTVWTLQWPSQALWAFLSFLATPQGTIMFGVVALAAVILPALTISSSGPGKLAVGASMHVVTSVAVVAVSVIAGLVLFAAAVMAFVVVMGYFLYVALTVVVSAMMINFLVKR
jgi:hypothetical protein